MTHPHPTRRSLMTAALATTAAAAALPAPAVETDDATWKVTNARINQSVIPWCFAPMKVEDLARAAARLGLKSVELCPPESWPLLKQLGLTCAIASSHGF